MKISIVGTGYVGLVTGACLAEMGNDVLCLDLNKEKIEILKQGRVPIHEPGLDKIIASNVAARRLHFTTDIDEAVGFGIIQFIAVGTPPDEDGSADLSYVLDAARNIGRRMQDYKLVVDKSTVPVGTADRVHAVIHEELTARGVNCGFSVVSNPEFLKEGSAVEDFMKPDRIIVGAGDEKAINLMKSLYAPFQRSHDKLVIMDVRSAELTKYAANAMLATRISFMNELALLSEKLGADIELVRHGIGSDPRIGYHFLYAGCGYGGSCFPKDVKALIKSGEDAGQELKVLRAVESANEQQKQVLTKKICQRFGNDLTGRKFAVWGLAFKPNTDDMREATSRVLIADLLSKGASVAAYDPIAGTEAARIFDTAPGLELTKTAELAARDADAIIVVTEWKEFRSPDFEELKTLLRNPIVFDGRNLYEPSVMKERGFEHYAIGR